MSEIIEYLGACRETYAAAPEACARVLLVGEDNPYGSAPEFALYNRPEGCSGERLQSRILGLREETYLAIWRTNLCLGKWSTRAAKERARELMQYTHRWTVIVMFGRKVADAFSAVLRESGYDRVFSPFTSTLVPSCEAVPDAFLVSLPHPSRRNTSWNDPRRTIDARMLLAEVVPTIPWGEIELDTLAREAAK